MLFSLLLGIVLGALIVIFALQNVAITAVTFLTWQITAPLAFILLATILSSAIITLLMLLPNLIREDLYLRSVKKEKREIEDEFARYRAANPEGISTYPGTEMRTVVEETTILS